MWRRETGFTLIEVLLAIFIGSLVLTSIYGIFTSVSQARNRLEAEGEAYHQVRVFFDRVGGELRSLRSLPVSGQNAFEVGRTLQGDEYFAFNTELVSPLLKQRGGLSRVRYEIRADDRETTTIYRSEQVLLANLAPSEALLFISGVKDFQLRFYQNGNWSQSLSGANVPELVEISFALDVGGKTTPFRSSFVPGQ